MAIKYYPLSRVKTNLNTRGNVYSLNGKSYTGPYYLTYDGLAYTGVNPVTGPNELLQLLNIIDAPSGGTNLQSRYNRLIKPGTRPIQETIQASQQTSTVSLKQLVPYYPVMVESYYQTGYFTRYFAKKVNMNSYIMEISEEDWTNITNNEDSTYEDYEVMDMFWQLKGPKNDQRVSQYEIKAGVYDTNKRVTEGKAKSFNGIIQYIGGDYTKYARITD